MESVTNVEMHKRNEAITRYVNEIWEQLSTQIELPDINNPLDRQRWLRKNGIGIHTAKRHICKRQQPL
jgi:hypothetical protein